MRHNARSRRKSSWQRRGGQITTAGSGKSSKQHQWQVISEGEFDASMLRYRGDRLASVAEIHPRFIPTAWDDQGNILGGYYESKAYPDRCVTIRELGSRTTWVEIKTWEVKDRHTHSDGIHQYELMVEALQDSGALGFYAVKWRWNGAEEWRFYPIWDLALTENRTLVFHREAGLAIPIAVDWPDWLPTIINHVKSLDCDPATLLPQFGPVGW